MSGVQAIMSAVGCIFAKNAKMQLMPSLKTFDYNLLRSHISENINQIYLCTQRGDDEQIDILMIELENLSYGETLGKTCQTLFTILDEMNNHDPAKECCMKEKIDSPTWAYRFNNVTFYIVVIAPCYDNSSSRYSYGSNSTFVVLQPAESFKRKHLTGETEISKETKNKIRDTFKDRGQEYNLSITQGDYECYRFIKPLVNSDPVVRWWEESTWLS